MTLLPLPPNCVALEELPNSECPQGILMELLGSIQHPYIYPILDLGFFHSEPHHYACLVMPFNPRGSLKDLIYKVSGTRRPFDSQLNAPNDSSLIVSQISPPIVAVERALDAEVHPEGARPAHFAGPTTRPAGSRGAAFPSRSRHSIARPFA